MKIQNKNFTTKLMSFVLVSAVFFVFYLVGQSETRQIKRNITISDARVHQTKMGHKGGVNLFYSYYAEGKVYYGKERYPFSSDSRNLFYNRSFPIAYSSKKPELNKILLLPSDFQKFNMSFPDSLQWLLKLRQ